MLVRFCFVLWELFIKFSSLQHQETTIILKLPQSNEVMNHSPLIARPPSSNFSKHIEVAGQNPDRVIEGWFSHVGTK